MEVAVLFSFIKSVCALLQPRPSYRHWVMSSLHLWPRWLCQQRGLSEPSISHSGPHCRQRSLQHSCSPRREVSHLKSADLELNFGLRNYITYVLKEPLLFFNYSGRKPRHRRAESPTPDIIVKKDKYNKGIVTCNKISEAPFRHAHHRVRVICWFYLWIIASVTFYIKVTTATSLCRIL